MAAAALSEGTFLFENGAGTSYLASNPIWSAGQPDNAAGTENWVHIWGTTYKANDAPNNAKAM